MQKDYSQVNIAIIIVNAKRSSEFNRQYRNQSNATNVISLEYSQSREVFKFLYGELILCDEVIVDEAINQNKSIMAHYAHMVIHGVLHLQGLDHQNDIEAIKMENLEVNILNGLGFANPYIGEL
ncbi:MAG: rRNA maturation RNase YbeY [Burkholderiales bacterium]|nr:rRNA maturation RNase YbeY [Burkholderiales bacterium]